MVSLFTNSLLLTGGGLDFWLKIVLRYGGPWCVWPAQQEKRRIPPHIAL